MDAIEKDLLMKIADLHGVPEGAYNIRENGKPAGRSSTANIEIVPQSRRKIGHRDLHQARDEKRKRAHSRHFEQGGLSGNGV